MALTGKMIPELDPFVENPSTDGNAKLAIQRSTDAEASHIKLEDLRTIPFPKGTEPITASGGFNGVVANADNVFDFLVNVFFPALSPLASLSGGYTKEFGDSATTSLSWTATKRTNPITSIVVAGTTIGATGNTQSGTLSFTPTQNVNTSTSMTVSDGSLSNTVSVNFNWAANRMLFKSSVDYTTSPNAATISTALNALSSGKTLGGSKAVTTSFTLSNEFAYIAYPDSQGALSSIQVNGLTNTAWLATGIVFNYTNSFGFVQSFRLYRSSNLLTGTYSVQYT